MKVFSIRSLALLLALVMLFSAVPVTVWAQTAQAEENAGQVEEILPDDVGEEEEEEDAYANPYEVTNASELEKALAEGHLAIRITADFVIDRTFYVVSDAIIYTEQAHTLTRDPAFGGDMFVVGEYEDGAVCENAVSLQFGHSESEEADLLVIDGNSANMTVPVVGSFVFVRANTSVKLYHNLTVKNCLKLGNERTLNAVYGLSYPEKVGGPVAVVAGGTMKIYGGNYVDNAVSTEGDVDSSRGGAFYFFGKADIYGGTFARNSANRGGAFYVYRTLRISGGVISDNTAAANGGAIYIPASSLAYLYVEGDGDSDEFVTFSGNEAGNYGGAIYGQGVKIEINAAEFNANTSGGAGGAIYCIISGSEDTDPRLSVTSSVFRSNQAGGSGGAVYINGSHGYFEDIVFDANQASSGDYGGGALYSTASYVEINGAEIKNNASTAKNGGALLARDGSKLVLNRITADANTTNSLGGFLYAHTANILLYNSFIRGSVSGGNGGAIYLTTDATLHAYMTSFENNSSGAIGGAIYVYTGAVESVLHSCVFVGNKAKTNGGAIYASNASILTAYNLTAKGNTANKGGFMYETTTNTTVTINGLIVEGNTATEGGPIIWGNTKYAKFYINKGNYLDLDLTGEMDDTYWASAIYNALTVSEISDPIPGFVDYGNSEETPFESIINPNITNIVELQRALAAGAKEITILSNIAIDRTLYITSDVTIYVSGNCTLTRRPYFGGDIFVIGQNQDGTLCEDKVTVTIQPMVESTLTIDGNSANMTETVVGSVFFICSTGHLNLHDGITVTNCVKVGNERTLDELHGLSYGENIGGAVAIIAGGSLDIYGGSYINNGCNTDSDSAASSRGGVIYAFGKMNIYGGTFSGNKAYRGGAFYIYRRVNIYNALIENNTAALGGAVYIPASSVAYLYLGGASTQTDSNVVFKNNSANNGGAIYSYGKLLQIENSKFIGNTSESHGGALGVYASSTDIEEPKLIIKDSSFTENTTDANGGAVYLNDTCAHMRNVDFIGNRSYATSNGGGAIYSTGALTKLESVRFTNNISGYNGGAMALYSGSQATLFNITAEGNTAGAYGGFIYTNSALNLYNSTVKNNTSTNSGGALYLTGNAVTNIYATDFVGNHGSNGGAIHVYTGTDCTLIQDCTFTENTATAYGGAVYVNNASGAKLYNITAKGNSGSHGGFMYITKIGTVVVINGLTVSGNTDANGGPIIWGNTTNAKLHINKANYTDLDTTAALDEAYWAKAIYNKLSVIETADEIPTYTQYGNENYEELSGYVDVSDADQLAQALADKKPIIRIVADFVLDRTFYIDYNVTIFSSAPYRLTRAPGFAGDLFVVGETAEGRSALLDGNPPKLTLGNPASQTPDLLVIDGNRYNTTVDVSGTVLFICHSAQVDIYTNVSVVNAQKVGNERMLDSKYATISTPHRIGGAAAIVESGVLNVRGASFRGNVANIANTAETTTDPLAYTSTYGGAIFSIGAVNVYDGSFSYNRALRGAALYNYRMMHIYGAELSNNYASSNGGAIYQANSEYATIFMGQGSAEGAIRFENNAAKTSGGAIYSNSLSSLIIYGGAVFENNRTEKSNGGAICSIGVLLAENTIFRNNEAYSKGGAVYLSYSNSSLTPRKSVLNNCTFENNTALHGGAVSLYTSGSTSEKSAQLTVSSSTFTGNRADLRTTGYGGAIYGLYGGKLIIEDTTFGDNYAITEGGAIYLGYETKATVKNSAFTGNSAGTETTGYGGAVSLHSSFLTAEDTEFTGNSAGLRGGAIYISYNSARAVDSQVKLTDCVLKENNSNLNGGAIFSTDRKLSPGVDEDGNALPKVDDGTLNLVLLNTELIGNTAVEKGGAIYLTNYSHAYMQDVAFTQNKITVEQTSHNAGAIYGSSSSTIEINGGTFTENVSGANGGAIGMYSSSSIILKSITATNNTAASWSGFMHLDTAYATIYDSAFTGNTAGGHAGVIGTVDSSTLHIYGSSFAGNTAGSYGGVFYIYPGAVQSVLQNCTFTGNTAGSYGGVIYISNASLLEMYNITATGNHASHGGFMYETKTGTAVTINGLTVSGNTAETGGPIIWGNTTGAKLYINKASYTDLDAAGELDEAYWAAAFYNSLTVIEQEGEIPTAPTYTVSYQPETEAALKGYGQIDVDKVFNLAQNANNGTISAAYDKLPKLDNSSNFMSLNTTRFPNINGSDVTVDTFVLHEGDVSDNCNVGEGLLIYQALCYKKAHPEENVKISISSFRLSVAAAICLDRESRYFGYMRALYGQNYDSYGFVRISYLLACAASMGIEVTIIGQLDGNPRSSSDPGFEEYFNRMMLSSCDADYAPGHNLGDFMNFRASHWTSYGDKGASDMMHTKLCAVSHYLDKDGVEHRNAVWTSSSNLDGINSSGTNGVNKLQTATLISDHAEIYRIAHNYLELVAAYSEQEDVYYFRDLAIAMSTQQIDLLNAGRGSEIPADQQIVYLGTENDPVFELYFAPFGGEMANWSEVYNPFAKYVRALYNSEDYILLTWNNVKWASYCLRNQLQLMITEAFHKNPNSANKIYVNLPGFAQEAFADLSVGKDIGFMSFNTYNQGGIHTKDLQVSYVENGQRYYVSLLNSMNTHGGSMAYQSNFALVIKETACTEDSVFFTIADETTKGIVTHNYDYSKELEYIPDTAEDGYKYYPCLDCDKILITETIHRESSWIIDKAATKSQNGIRHRNCQACGILLETQEYAVSGENSVLSLDDVVGVEFTQNITNDQKLQLPTTPLTFEAVIQVPKSNSDRAGVIVGNYDETSRNRLNVEIYTHGRPRLFMTNNGESYDCVFDSDVRSDQPVHIALTVDGKLATLYVNGKMAEQKELPFPLPTLDKPYIIGGDARWDNAAYFKGILYSVNLFSDVRTASEVQRDAVAVHPGEEGLLASQYYRSQPQSVIPGVPAGKTFTQTEQYSLGSLSSAPLTIEAVIQLSKSQTDRAGVILGNYTATGVNRLNLEVYSGGKLRLFFTNNGVTNDCIFNVDVRSDSSVHIAVVVEDLVATAYLNGVAKDSIQLTCPLPSELQDMKIGSDNRIPNLQYFKGSIYAVHLFDAVRTAEQIQKDMIFVHGKGSNILYSRTFAVSGVVDDAMGATFSQNEKYEIGTLPSTPKTFEATVYASIMNNNRMGVIVGNYDAGRLNRLNFEIYANGRPRLFITNNGENYDCIFDTDVRSGQPVHLALTVDGTLATLYVNGKMAEQKELPFGLPVLTNVYTIGGDSRYGNTAFFTGSICNVNLFTDVRTAEEIASDMASVASGAEGLSFSKSFTGNNVAGEAKDYIATNKMFTPESLISVNDLLAQAPQTFEALIHVPKSMDNRAGVIIGNYDLGRANRLNFEIYTYGRPRLFITNNGENYDCIFDTDIRADCPVHIALTVDGTTVSLYLNGELAEQKELPFGLPALTKGYTIGGDERYSNYAYFQGAIYSVSMFSDVRTADTIRQDMVTLASQDPALLYNTIFVQDICQFYGHDESDLIVDFDSTVEGCGISHTECLVCGKVITCYKEAAIAGVVQSINYANKTGLKTDTENGGYAVEAPLASAPLTFEAQIQLDRDYGLRAGVLIGNYDASLNDQINFEVYTNGKPRLFYRVDGVAYTYNFKTDVRSDAPIHIALTVDGLNVSLYLDGKLVETLTIDVPLPTGALDNFVIGSDNRAGNTQHFKGLIYHAAMFGDVRTAEEIALDKYLIASDSDNLLFSQSLLQEAVQ